MEPEAHPKAIDKINNQSLQLYNDVRIIDFGSHEKTNIDSDIPISFTITDDDLTGDPVVHDKTVSGDLGISFFSIGSDPYGIQGDSINLLDDLISNLVKNKDISVAVSDEYLESAIFDWIKNRKRELQHDDFWSFLTKKLDHDVRAISIFVPIDGVSIKTEFQFGGVSVLPFEKSHFDRWESLIQENDDVQTEQAKAFLDRMRRDMQGLAAVRVNLRAEPGFANKSSFQVAVRVCEAIRIFSPQRYNMSKRASYAPRGVALHPMRHTVSLTDVGYSYSSSLLDAGGQHWAIDENYLKRMFEDGFGRAFEIAVAGPKNEFQEHVWKGISAFSKSLTPVDINDRLAFRLAAVESLLLRNSSEPIGTMVGDRMAFLLSTKGDERRGIVKRFKSAYKMRSDYVHHRKTRNEQNEMEQFAVLAWQVMQIALRNVDSFSRTEEFFEAIENKRYGA